jgi:putative YhbY family RNA-binding protein
MPLLTPSARRELRARAHTLKPVVLVGHQGLTPAVLHEIDVALAARELVKIRASGEDRGKREALLARICAELGCAPVQHLGKVLTVWRPAPPEERKRERPARGEPAGPAGDRPRARRRAPAPTARRRRRVQP